MDLKPGELYQGLTGLISGHGGQKTGLRVLVWVLNGPRGGTDGRTEGRMDGRKDGHLEIPPCVLQDIGPLGPLPKKQFQVLLRIFYLPWSNGFGFTIMGDR